MAKGKQFIDRTLVNVSPVTKTIVRISYVLFLCIFATFSVFALFVIETKESAFDLALLDNGPNVHIAKPFPIGVNPLTEAIEENPSVDAFFETQITAATKDRSKLSWWRRNVTAKLALFDWYQNLASPISRILVVQPGERREEIVDNIGDILHWNNEDRTTFATLIASSSPELREGKFYPGKYVVEKDAIPEVVANKITEQFEVEIASRYTDDISKVVPFEDAMIIASLLEREAYDFTDMRYISGIIWNRLFADMNLQIDASLQYAKATGAGNTWWPVPRPSDKYIKSSFNTYKNSGLPPSPIANPSPEAILAALNPKETECMFYFHDRDAGFHCSKTYEEHVASLKQYYGRGK